MPIDEDEFSRARLGQFLLARDIARANGEEWPKQLGADAQVLDFVQAHFNKLFRAREAARANSDSDRT